MDEQQQWNHFHVAVLDLLRNEHYQAQIHEMLETGQTRLRLNIDHLRAVDEELPTLVLDSPAEAIKVVERALDDAVTSAMEGNKKTAERYRVGFDGNFGSRHISPRGLKSAFTNKLVRVQGIVTRMSVARPKLMFSQHYCEHTKKFVDKTYSDQYDLAVLQNSTINNAIPAHDPEGHPYSFEYGLSAYKDYQTLTVQELPERAPMGQLPRSVEVVVEEDLVGKVKPGDRIEAVGVFRTINTSGTSAWGIFRTVLICNNIYSLATDLGVSSLSGEDLKQIKQVALRPDCLDLLGDSFAPSIFGHEAIKISLVLLLLGGVEKNLDNGTHLRGDINILLIGDPSTAKSQLLRAVLHTAPLATNTTGRGASGVGLTAAVSIDRETGERQLEAGAMVLADRGVICIDEFDKMNELDRVAIHEVMEQQTVTITKAGVHASLNARCSVVAAANPIYGTYARDKLPSYNISMPDSLLSRFDLLFVVLDSREPEMDRMIARTVISNHTSSKAMGLEDMDLDNPVVEPEPVETTEEGEEPIYVIYREREILHRGFLKKYLHFAKNRMNPVITDLAADYISTAWTEIRQKDEQGEKYKIVFITVRTLETIIRLATAIAKAHLSADVTVQHVDRALELLKFAIYREDTHDSAPIPRRGVDAEEEPPEGKKGSQRTRKRPDDIGEVSELLSKMSSIESRGDPRLRLVYKTIVEMSEQGQRKIGEVELWRTVKNSPEKLFKARSEFNEIIRKLDEQNKIVYNEREKSIIFTDQA